MKKGKYLFIHASNKCQYHCNFCMHRKGKSNINVNEIQMPDFLDFYELWDGLEYAIGEVQPTHIEITGLGEPGLNPNLSNIAYVINQQFKGEKHIFTNGAAIKTVENSEQFKGWILNVSVHHSDSGRRAAIFGTNNLKGIEEIKHDKVIFHFVRPEPEIPTKEEIINFWEFSVRYNARCMIRSTRTTNINHLEKFKEAVGFWYEESKGCDTYPVIATDGKFYEKWSDIQKTTQNLIG